MDKEASAQARLKGLNVFTGNLFEANYPDHFFDVVRLSFVLEHLSNPRETLREIKRIILSQGRIYISIQNARSLHYWLFGKNWFSLDVPRHLFSFTPKTIQRLLFSLGLKVKTIRFDSGTRTFLGSLQYWMNDQFYQGAMAQSKQQIMKSHILRRFFRPLCWVIDRVRLGDLIYLEIIQG
jgi:ubiquinone/menaquinone biosynthesis C-methylase UbiE